MPKKLTREEFIKRARQVHGWRFDYSKVVYINSYHKITIMCPVHGEFEQEANSHLQGHGCPYCSQRFLKTTEDFIEEARKMHGDKYDYSKTIYESAIKKILITCPEHGEFWQTPNGHLSGHGCFECGNELRAKKNTKSQEEVVNEFTLIHGNKYDYSQVKYISALTPVKIICPKHGSFLMKPSEHLQGKGCRKCGYIRNSINFRGTTESFISKTKEIHGDKYIYDLVEYNTAKTPVNIICPIHGVFSQTPSEHLNGSGCPICKTSHGERIINRWLQDNNIKFKPQYTIIPRQGTLLGRNKFRVDFYLPIQKTIIEFNGKQHYERAKIWHTEEQFQDQLDRDSRLREHCKQNGIKLIEIPYTNIDDIDKILTRKLLNNKK